MLRIHPHLTPLAWRKQLLVSECNQQRAQLSDDCKLLVVGIRTQVAADGTISALAKATSCAAAFFQPPLPQPEPPQEPIRFIQKTLAITHTLLALWCSLRCDTRLK